MCLQFGVRRWALSVARLLPTVVLRGKQPAISKHRRAKSFAKSGRVFYFSRMSATEIIEQFKALPASERAQVAKFVVENDDSWVPESFKQGMADAVAGRFADMETVLSGAKPPSRAAE